MKQFESQVGDDESVVRLLSTYWVSNNEILHVAFTLREKETYISVNRPSIASYSTDVVTFLSNHSDFYSDKEKREYRRAALSVADIRNIRIAVDNMFLQTEVEVEPRNQYQKSHAGIFTRVSGKNLKVGDFLVSSTLKKGISADVILLAVRSRLLDMARLETLTL